MSGTYDELYAVATLLVERNQMAQAELCLADALASTVPAYTLLSDINTALAQNSLLLEQSERQLEANVVAARIALIAESMARTWGLVALSLCTTPTTA